MGFLDKMKSSVVASAQQPQMYASMFTLALFLVFGFPLFSSVYLCADRDVQVWIGFWPLIGLIWVPFFLVAHLLHLQYGRPKKSLMMGCMFTPCIWFFLVGWMLLSESTHYYTMLRGSECSRFPKVAAINDAYLEAKTFHASCVNAERKAMLIHYCTGYDKAESKQELGWAWEYLRYAEKNFGCAGFCENMQPTLWTYQGIAKDGCSTAVGTIMGRKVHKMAVGMMMYSVLVVASFLLWIELLGPSLNAYLSSQSRSEARKVERLSSRTNLLPGPGPQSAPPQQQQYASFGPSGGPAAGGPQSAPPGPYMPSQQQMPYSSSGLYMQAGPR